MSKRYSNAVLLLHQNDKQIPVIHSGCSDNGTSFTFSSLEKNYRFNYDNPTVEITPFLPEVGYYNVLGNLVYCVKNPERQWRRSFCGSVYKFYAGIDNLPLNVRTNVSFYLQAASDILNPLYANLDEIKTKLQSNVALNRQFAICTTQNGEYVLAFRRYIIGTVDFETKEITLIQETLRQEVQDFFRRKGIVQWKLK